MNNIVEKSVLDGIPMLNLKAFNKWIDETNERLTAVEKKVENNVSLEFKPERVVFSAEVVDKKLYDKLEAKHEADCRLISEYDLENKRLKDKCEYLEKENKTFNVLLINKTEEKHDKLLKDYKLLSESNNNRATDNIELEGELEAKTNHIAALEEKVRNQRTDLTSLQEKYEDALKMNKAREDVYYQNQILAKNIKAKDREICLLRAELDKYKTDDECDDRWID